LSKTLRILVLVSGNGSNLQALIDAEAAGRLNGGQIALVVSDKADAYALERARRAQIPVKIIEINSGLPKDERRRDLSERILAAALEAGIDLIVYAGFMRILEGNLLQVYEGRMMNIHPSLLPRHGGPGMYGAHVHQAVLDAGDAESGCTVHLVSKNVDAGPILLQRRVPVLPADTPETPAPRNNTEPHLPMVAAAHKMLAANGKKKRP
jgi:phosphoribosylglycinamide formyltransferase-1